jgi:hypothetical protein
MIHKEWKNKKSILIESKSKKNYCEIIKVNGKSSYGSKKQKKLLWGNQNKYQIFIMNENKQNDFETMKSNQK